MHWTVKIDGGPRRVNHAAAAVNEVIYSFGGYCTGDNYKDISVPIDIFVLRSDTYRWHAVPKPTADDPERKNWPYQRYGHTVAPHENKIYLFGGRNDEAPCNVLYTFDTQTYKWSRPRVHGFLPVERDGHSACIINDAMYIYGGYEESHLRFGLDVYKLDLKTMTWSMVHCTGSQPLLRDFHSATAIGDYMFVFGGRSNSGGWPGHMLGNEMYTNRVHFLDTTTSTWHNPAITDNCQPDGRRSHSALNFQGKLLIFGGYNGRINKHYNDMWLLDPMTWKWTLVKPSGIGPQPRRRQAMCMVGNRIFLFGGTSPYNGPPIFFTPDQLELIPDQEGANNGNLIDHNDLFVLDINPSLKTLCLIHVLKLGLDTRHLPYDVSIDLENMTKANSISTALRTLPFG